MRFDARWDGERCNHYTLATDSAWAPVELGLEGTGEPLGRLDGFADAEDTLVVLTHPLDGYYLRTDRRLGTYSIWHAPLALRHARVRTARFRLFERLGIVAPAAELAPSRVEREAPRCSRARFDCWCTGRVLTCIITISPT